LGRMRDIDAPACELPVQVVVAAPHTGDPCLEFVPAGAS